MSSVVTQRFNPSAGDHFDGYEVLKAISKTAESRVFAAHDPDTSEDVIIKVGLTDERQMALKREAQILASINLPNGPSLIRTGAPDGRAYIALSIVPGRSLQNRLQSGPPPTEPETRELLTQLTDALETIHSRGYTHRDIKPSNVIVRPDGVPVIIDFGAAASAGDTDSSAYADLTPGYAAPEQYERNGQEGPWTDIYALGAIGYHMLTGRVPPDARQRYQGAALPSVRTVGRDGQYSGLLAAIDGALQLDDTVRPASAQVFRDLLAVPPAGEAGDTTAHGSEGDIPTQRIERLTDLRPAPMVPAATIQPPPATRGVPRGLRRTGRFLAVCIIAAGLFLTWAPRRPDIQDLWVVDPAGQGDTTTIGEAVQRAPDEATISVMPGVYNETLILDRPLFIVGTDPANRAKVLPSLGPCVLASASHGLVAGLEFGPADSDGTCIVLANSGVAIESNVISGRTGPAISVSGEAHPLIRNNKIAEIDGSGILVQAGAGGWILENEITQTKLPAIIVSDGARPVINRNVISETQQAGVLFERGSAGLLLDNDILASQASGIELRDAARPTIRNNRIQAGRQAGIYAYDGAFGQIVGNAITDNSFSGIVLDGASPVVRGNEIQDNAEHGVLVVNSSKGEVRDNAITGNGGHGVAVSLGAEPEVEANTLSNNEDPQTQYGIMSETDP